MKPGSAIGKSTFYAFCLVLFVHLASVLDAAVLDNLTSGTISDPSQLWSPGKLSIDENSVIYAVDSYKDRIVKYDSAGNHLGVIKIDRPSAVAVSRDGTMYIGSHRDYSVAIFKDGKRTGSLGEGKGEFSSILDIAVDEALGDVYVADSAKNSIKVYYPSGIPKGTFSGFKSPVAVTVSDENVYVLDAPVGSSHDQSTGSRISVFSKSGGYLWGIDERAKKEGAMIRPVDIVVDRIGNVFVADASRKSVLVYDKRGIFTGRIASPGGAINTAVSLALSRDNRLYVSSSETHSIMEIGLQGAAYSKPGPSLDFQSGTGVRLTPAVLGY